jgi:hypothetical protein
MQLGGRADVLHPVIWSDFAIDPTKRTTSNFVQIL